MKIDAIVASSAVANGTGAWTPIEVLRHVAQMIKDTEVFFLEKDEWGPPDDDGGALPASMVKVGIVDDAFVKDGDLVAKINMDDSTELAHVLAIAQPFAPAPEPVYKFLKMEAPKAYPGIRMLCKINADGALYMPYWARVCFATVVPNERCGVFRRDGTNIWHGPPPVHGQV